MRERERERERERYFHSASWEEDIFRDLRGPQRERKRNKAPYSESESNTEFRGGFPKFTTVFFFRYLFSFTTFVANWMRLS